MANKIWMHRAAYAVMRKDITWSDGDDGYDTDYPVESVFLSRDSAEWYVAELLNDMRKTNEYDDYLDEQLFEIREVPLVTAFGEDKL